MSSRSTVKAVLSLAVFSLLTFSSGTLELFKDGGARDQGVVNRVEYNGVLNYVTAGWCILACGAILLTAYASGRINLSRGRLPIALGILALASCAWTSHILVSLKAVVLLLLGTVVIAIFNAQRDSAYLLRFLALSLLPLIAASLISIMFFPSYGISVGTHEGAWQGLFDHKNGLGSYAAISLCVFLGWRRAGGPAWVYFAAGACLALSLGSQSFTSAAASICVIAVHAVSSTSLSRVLINRSSFLLIILLVSTPLIITAVPVLGSGFEIAGKGALFSGRGYIWTYLLEGVGENPILGNGFNAYKNAVYSGSNDGALLASIGFLPGSAHNGFLEVAHSMGILGLALSFALVGAPILFSKGTEYSMLAIYVAICAVIVNSFDSRLAAFDSLYFVLVYVCCLASRQRSHIYN